MSDATESLTLQLLEWISDRPRAYAEVMDACHTTCPQLSIWEDGVDGFMEHEPGSRIVSVSAKGKTWIQNAEYGAREGDALAVGLRRKQRQ